MSFLVTLLYVAASLITAGGVLILWSLSETPVTLPQNMRDGARYLVIGGGLFGAVFAVLGWPLQLHLANTATMVGIAWLIGDHARSTHLLAKLQEKLRKKEQAEYDEGQESGT